MPDSTTFANIGAFLSTVSPSWSMVVLLIGLGIIYSVGVVIRNSKFVEVIIKYFESHNAMVDTVKAIRVDQLESNKERQEMTTSIEKIDKRMTVLEQKVEMLSCSNSPNCTNRNKQ